MPATTAIAPYQPSENTQLASSLMGLRSALHTAALANVEQAGEGFTEAEKVAMTAIEELKLINGMDLAALLLRYEKICQIRDQGLWTVHPGGYTTIEMMAASQGISSSKFHNIMDLCGVIFPFIETELGMSVPVLWERIGKSNFRELVPIFKAVITGEMPDTGSTRQSVERLLDDVAATAQSAGQDLNEGEIRLQAARNLLEAGELTSRELRNRIRPSRTPSIGATVLRSNGHRFVLAEVTEEQFTMMQRRLNGYMDATPIDLPQDTRQRQRETHRIPVLATILSNLENL